jgi:hypothetical protein
MRIFSTKWFTRWANKEGLSNKVLKEAIHEMEQGLIDANLGSHLFKKRIPVEGRGKSGGIRTLLAFKVKDKAFFIYGFAKNQRDNITDKELQALKLWASQLLAYDDNALTKAIQNNELYEVYDEA